MMLEKNQVELREAIVEMWRGIIALKLEVPMKVANDVEERWVKVLYEINRWRNQDDT